MSLEVSMKSLSSSLASPPEMDSGARGGRRSKTRRGGGSGGSLGLGAESTEEYMAVCLVMLSRGVRDKPAKVAVSHQKEGYECSVCGKMYASYQALGGHKTKHRKSPTQVAVAAAAAAATGGEASGGGSGDGRVHQCKLCLRMFPSGQALGGHKRLHDRGGAAAKGIGGKDKKAPKARAAAATSLLNFDLNLPAATAAVGDEAESALPEAKRARVTAI